MRLAPVFLGSLARRRMATLFSFIAIVLGVALGMAVQAVHEAALSEFGRSLRALAGEADLQVVGPLGGFDENLYAVLASHSEVAAASPLLELEVKRTGTDETLQLIGVDVFALAGVTPVLLPRPAAESGRFAALSDDTVFLSGAAQAALGLKLGDSVDFQAGTLNTSFKLAGDIPGAAENRRLVLMDIAAVQYRFGKIGRLTRIDLRLAEGVSPDAARSTLQALLPAGVLIEAPEAAADQAANLSRAYRVNLTMLAAIALLTGGFLVFSAQALSVVRRRTEFAFLRALGLARRSLFVWLLAEGALVGLAGGVVGVIAPWNYPYLTAVNSIVPALMACADGGLKHFDLRWSDEAALTVEEDPAGALVLELVHVRDERVRLGELDRLLDPSRARQELLQVADLVALGHDHRVLLAHTHRLEADQRLAAATGRSCGAAEQPRPERADRQRAAAGHRFASPAG